MAATPSRMVPLGTKAVDFELQDAVSGKYYRLNDFKSEKATVIMFICNHCPFVIHILHGLTAIIREYSKQGIKFVAINSNDVINYPQDSPEKMKSLAEEMKWEFPYLFDETQQVAKHYQAACTPDFYVFDKNLHLVYRGQFDSSRPGNNIEVSGEDLALALSNILQNKPITQEQKPSIGCNIKWKNAN